MALQHYQEFLNALDGDTLLIKSDIKSLANASIDRSFHKSKRPDLVIFPRSAEQIAAVVKVCDRHNITITPRGAGTGLEGGCIPIHGGVVIETCNLRRFDLLEKDLLCWVGAGTKKLEILSYLKPFNLTFGPDPSSNPSIGGMASTGGSGMSTLKYGTTRENIVSLKVVTPQGEIIQTRQPVRKSSSGYELNQLYMGSEGTLGIIAELLLRVSRIPKFRCGALIEFEDIASAVSSVVELRNTQITSLVRCELMNAEGIECTNKVFETNLKVTPTLFFELQGEAFEALEIEFKCIESISKAHGSLGVVFASDGKQLDSLWDARRGCYFATLQYKEGLTKAFISDVCVPISKLTECVVETERDFAANTIPCIICAHIADGNFHCVIPYQEEGRQLVKILENRLIERALKMDGTVSGEHGVGMGKIEHALKEHGEHHIDIQRRIKKALDPKNILNPSKMLPPSHL